MKLPVVAPVYTRPMDESTVARILRRWGAYYESADLFYQKLWKQRLAQAGFRVMAVEKMSYHQVWDIRCYGTRAAQSYLLMSLPVTKVNPVSDDLFLRQIAREVQYIAKDLGLPIKTDCISVSRKGAYFRICFLWPRGKPGRWAKAEKKAEAFSFRIRAWLRKNRN